jgi:hypothetical protein
MGITVFATGIATGLERRGAPWWRAAGQTVSHDVL